MHAFVKNKSGRTKKFHYKNVNKMIIFSGVNKTFLSKQTKKHYKNINKLDRGEISI